MLPRAMPGITTRGSVVFYPYRVLNPSQPAPDALQQTALMTTPTTEEPPAAEEILADDHAKANEHGVGYAHKPVAGQPVAAENETADNRLKQVVGKAHAPEDAQVAEPAPYTLKGIPGRDHRRHNHQQNHQVVDGREPLRQPAKRRDTQHNHCHCRYSQQAVPHPQVTPLVVEQPLPAQLHAENEETEQLRQSPAEDVEPQVELKAILQVVHGILPERPVLVQGNRLVVNLEEPRVVSRSARQQAKQLNRLDSQQADDAPHPLRRQVADGDEQQPVGGIEHQDVTVVERHIDKAKPEQQAHAPGKAPGKRPPPLLLVIVHDEEAQPEEHGKDAVHLAAQEPCQNRPHSLVAGQRVDNRLLCEDVEVLHRVIQDDAPHGYSP